VLQSCIICYFKKNMSLLFHGIVTNDENCGILQVWI
jgi:hypothetical protein